jgi:predicted aminopeptidase
MTAKPRLFILLLLSLAVAACASPAYYFQAVSGEARILAKRRPIQEVLNDPATPAPTRKQLELVLRVREFASRELQLPDNRSYRSYVDLHRPYAAWNVFAAPELSLKPRTWCFIVAGCVPYRGYFARAAAERYAAALKQKGYDVYVGGVLAFSTLGWFNDPLLNTFLDRPEADLAGLLFHELAHQKIYVGGDTGFNESFATAVELEGVKRWYERHGTPQQAEAYRQKRRRRDEFAGLVIRHRARLAEIYASNLSAAGKRAAKAREFAELRQDYAALKAAWGGDATYDGWFAGDLNNAKLVAVGLYTQYVPAFQRLLARHDGDLAAFYRAADRLAHLPQTPRDAALRELMANGQRLAGCAKTKRCAPVTSVGALR